MGVFNIRIEVGDISGSRFEPLEAMVDTGAIYSAIPGSILAGLGVEPRQTLSFELADNSSVALSVGYATIRIEQQEVIVMVISAPDHAQPLVGATTLETAGYGVDSLNQRLMEVPRPLKPSSNGSTA